MTSDEIARTLAAMERVQPFEMTDLERAAIEADRLARKEWEKSRFFERPSPSQCGGVRASYGLRVPSPTTRTGTASCRRFAETGMG